MTRIGRFALLAGFALTTAAPSLLAQESQPSNPFGFQPQSEVEVYGVWEADLSYTVADQVRAGATPFMTLEQLERSVFFMEFLRDGTFRSTVVRDGELIEQRGTFDIVEREGRTFGIDAAADGGVTRRLDATLGGDNSLTLHQAGTTFYLNPSSYEMRGIMVERATEDLPRVTYTQLEPHAGYRPEIPIPEIVLPADVDSPDAICPRDDWAWGRVDAFDANGDGAEDYIVYDPCLQGANSGDISVMVREGDGVRTVLDTYAADLLPTAEVVNGWAELRAFEQDGMEDTKFVYYRMGDAGVYVMDREERVVFGE